MALTRRSLLAGICAIALAGCTCARGAARETAALRRAVAWSWGQQAPNGSFPSRTYGLLRDGQSLTPFVLHALLQVGDDVAPRDDVATDRAIAFMLSACRGGALGLAAQAPDYPVYATSLMIQAVALAAPAGWRDAVAPSVAWLAGQQLRADLGWGEHPGEGGFPMGRAVPLAPPNAGHVDLSMTRRALEALALVGGHERALEAGARFVRRCHAANGGFVYSPVERGVNKGRTADDGALLGYGSASADGILALLACGASPDDPTIGEALAFLHDLHTWDVNPGIGDGPLAGYAEAMRGYWWASASSVYRRLGGPPGWRDGLVDTIVACQRDDGSWANPSPLQKEDDPIVATTFAIQALVNALA